MTQRMILGLMAAVSIWGAVLAFGAYRWQGGNLWRGAIVALFVAGFLQFWLVALINRARVLAKRKAALSQADQQAFSHPEAAVGNEPVGDDAAKLAEQTLAAREPEESGFPPPRPKE
ncbi:MAG TPA: hypothetical protein VGE52_21905 [Pirellulales bacterium]